jgi:N-carbamoyl-L-amino-acid hydrolase
VSNDAFLKDFHHIATIGATSGNGVDRQAATSEDGRTRSWFADWGNQHGWAMRVDGIGNMFALLEWRPGAPFVIIGSHLDSQPLAGRFDGAFGIIGGLHCGPGCGKTGASIG